MRDYYTDRDHSFTAGFSEEPVYVIPATSCQGAGCDGTDCHCQSCGEVAPLNDLDYCKACVEFKKARTCE